MRGGFILVPSSRVLSIILGGGGTHGRSLRRLFTSCLQSETKRDEGCCLVPFPLLFQPVMLPYGEVALIIKTDLPSSVSPV